MGIRRISIDRREGIATGLGLRRQFFWIRPAAGSATAVRAAIDISAYVIGTVVRTTTSITNPDYARPVTYVLTDANASITRHRVKVIGTLRDGSSISEEKILTAAGTVNGSVPFDTVTAIEQELQAGAAGAGDTLSIGTQSTKFGMPDEIRDVSDIKTLKMGIFDSAGGATDAAFVAETVAGYDAVNNVITFTTAANAARTFIIDYQSEKGIIVGQTN